MMNYDMKTLRDYLLGAAFFGIILIVGFAASNRPQSTSLGAALPQSVAVFETSLASPISSSATSMTLTANSIRGGGALSGFNCFTVDEGSAQAETICGTVSGTTVSSLTRGISQSTGTTTVAALQFSHRRGANVKITDFPILQILKAQASGEDTYPNPLTYANGQHPCSVSSASTTICDKNYSDNLVAAGASAGSNSVAGIFLSATGAQAASSTASGTYNAVTYNYVLPASIATDTPNTATRGTKVLMSLITGYLNQAWLNLTEAFTWTGAHIFNGTLTANATTTIAASSVTNNALTLNGIPYAFPPTQSASSTILSTNGSGSLYWTQAPAASYVGTTISTTTSNSTNGTWSQDTAYTTGFQPSTIVLYLRGNSSHGGVASFVVSTNIFNGTSCTGGLILKPESTVDSILPSATTVGCALDAGSASYSSDERLTASIPSVTSTGFTVRITRSQGGTYSGAGMSISPVAYR